MHHTQKLETGNQEGQQTEVRFLGKVQRGRVRRSGVMYIVSRITFLRKR